MKEDEIGKIVVNSALQVHRALGPGLLESTYESCLRYELSLNKLNVEYQKGLPVIYKGLRMDIENFDDPQNMVAGISLHYIIQKNLQICRLV